MASAAPTASAAPSAAEAASAAYVSSTFQDEVAAAKEAERGQSWKDRRSATQGEKRFVHTEDQKKQAQRLREHLPRMHVMHSTPYLLFCPCVLSLSWPSAFAVCRRPRPR